MLAAAQAGEPFVVPYFVPNSSNSRGTIGHSGLLPRPFQFVKPLITFSLYVVRAFRTVGLAIQENVWLIWFEGSGCNCLLMQAASLLDGFSFDLFPPFENDLAAPKVDVSRRQVVQALVVSTVVVVPDELLDALFELSWQVVVVQQDPVFHRANIARSILPRVIGW